ncbi:MAG: hypothetical protein JF589_15940 [Gemmatimonadetes bacterium]|jgi:hypothetical protein|nr:hypothetical protein [Gemmatimonadota bacterium]
MPATSPMYDQLRHGTLRNRALAWFADHSYRRAAAGGALFALEINVVIFLVGELDRLLPGPDLEPALSLSNRLLVGVFSVILLALLRCLATASARGLLRLYLRARTT